MTAAALADWTTPQPFALPDLGPGLEGERRVDLELALRAIAADPTVQALVLFGSRATGTAQFRPRPAGGGAHPPPGRSGDGGQLVAPL